EHARQQVGGQAWGANRSVCAADGTVPSDHCLVPSAHEVARSGAQTSHTPVVNGGSPSTTRVFTRGCSAIEISSGTIVHRWPYGDPATCFGTSAWGRKSTELMSCQNDSRVEVTSSASSLPSDTPVRGGTASLRRRVAQS